MLQAKDDRKESEKFYDLMYNKFAYWRIMNNEIEKYGDLREIEGAQSNKGEGKIKQITILRKDNENKVKET